jgi:SAM-dependent methyltransferase
MNVTEPSSTNAPAPTLLSFIQRNADQGGRKLRKYANYIDLYEHILSRFVGRCPRILEIGVQHGGSLRMWNEFFQGNVEIFGVDILPECKKLEEDNVHIFIGDQSDKAFLTRLSENIGQVDVIIDDGSHIGRHQIATFEQLFYNNLTPGGYYVVEDCHCSYWAEYGGGLRRRGTFVEYSKNLCDAINAWYAKSTKLPVTEATRWIKRVSFESSVVMIEKQYMMAPPVLSSGIEEIDTHDIFKDVQYGPLLRYLRGFAPVRAAVRNNQFLWKIMSGAIEKRRK